MLRRKFITNTGALIGGSWITMSLSSIMAAASTASKAAGEKQGFRALSENEATEFGAIAAQIIPSNDTPGAREAGAIYLIDTVLADIDPKIHEPLKQGLQDFQDTLQSTYGVSSFASLDQQQQIEALTSIEDTDFFGTLRFLTIAGTFCDPSLGGNRNRIGWDLIGFEGAQASQPPFGYYDADYLKKGA